MLQAMFTAGLAESDMEVVTLQGVEPDMIHRLIEYAYTGTKQAVLRIRDILVWIRIRGSMWILLFCH
jgi:hypothetical protein